MGVFGSAILGAALAPVASRTLGKKRGAIIIGLYGTLDHRWMADDDFSTSWGGVLSGGFSVTPVDLVFADAGCSQRRFEHNWQQTDLTYQNGHMCFLSGRYDHYFDSLTYLRALGSLGQERTGRKHLDNDSWAAGAGIYRELPWGITVYLQGLYTRTEFDGSYPGFPVSRADDRTDVSLNLTKRDFAIFGLAPMLQYTYTHNDSNIPISTYDAHGIALTLTKRF